MVSGELTLGGWLWDGGLIAAMGYPERQGKWVQKCGTKSRTLPVGNRVLSYQDDRHVSISDQGSKSSWPFTSRTDLHWFGRTLTTTGFTRALFEPFIIVRAQAVRCHHDHVHRSASGDSKLATAWHNPAP